MFTRFKKMSSYSCCVTACRVQYRRVTEHNKKRRWKNTLFAVTKCVERRHPSFGISGRQRQPRATESGRRRTPPPRHCWPIFENADLIAAVRARKAVACVIVQGRACMKCIFTWCVMTSLERENAQQTSLCLTTTKANFSDFLIAKCHSQI